MKGLNFKMIKNNKKNKSKKKKYKLTLRGKRSIIILLIVIIIFLKLISSKGNNDLRLIFNYIDITPNLSRILIKNDDIIYMSMEDILKYIDNNIYEEDNLIIATSDLKVASLELNKNYITINGSQQNISGSAFKIDEIVYIPISEMEKVYNLDFEYSNSSNIVTIDDLKNAKKTAVAKKKISIKKEKNIFSKTLSKVKKNETLVYITEEGNWVKVMDKDGNVGYTKNAKLKDIKLEREEFKIKDYAQNVSGEEILEENITEENIDKFNERKNLIEKIFMKAIENEKKCVKIIFNGDNPKFERLKIEGTPIFNECGIYVEFIK